MGELRRIINKWTLILIFLAVCFTSVLFYQINNSTEHDGTKISSKDVYFYYNQMLNDYYNNLDTMDEKQAQFIARARVYMIQNMEQWNIIKEQDSIQYYAQKYDKKIENYKKTAPEVYDYYQELKQSNSIILKDYIEKADAVDMALKLYDESFNYVNGYSEMIDTYIAQGNAMLRTDIYSDVSTFAHTNILKSKYDFRKLYNVDINPDNSKAISSVVSAGAYINIFILLIALVCVFRFFEDRKNGLIHIVYASKRGRGQLTLKRIGILAVVSVISTVFIYTCQFIVAFHIYGGLEFMGNSLQSSPDYATICFTHNKWIFIFMLLFLSASAVFMTALIVWFFVGLFNNITIGMGSAVIILCIFYILYIVIPDKSVFVLFKTINIWNLILPLNIVASYGNIGVGTFIIDKIYAAMIIIATVIVLFTIFCAAESIRIKVIRKTGFIDKLNVKASVQWQKIVSKFTQLLMELYKLLWIHKGIFVIAVIMIIAGKSGIKKGYMYDPDMSVALSYYKEAEGMILSDDLMQIVSKYEKEKEYWDNRLKDIISSDENNEGLYSSEDLAEANSQVSLYQIGVDEIHRNIDNLNKLKSKGMQGTVTAPFVIEEMLGDKLYSYHKTYGFLAVIGLIFLLFGIFADERRQKMKNLIHTASLGRGKWFEVKTAAVLITTVILWAVVFIPEFINVTGRYGAWGKSVIAQDYPILSDIPIEMSLNTYLICEILWKLIMLFSLAGIIILISSICEYILSVIVSLSLVVTHILCLLGFENLYYLSIVSPLLISENLGRSGGQINGIIFLIIGIVCWCAALYREVLKK